MSSSTNDTCIVDTCPSTPPVCTGCTENQQCEVIAESCSACASAHCVDIESPSSSSGVSSGALAGGIVGALLFLLLALLAFLFYRRRLTARRAQEAALEPKPDVPASAETVLSRPDPIEKALASLSNRSTLVDLPPGVVHLVGPHSLNNNNNNAAPQPSHSHAPDVPVSTSDLRRQSTHHSVQSNPFTDGHSIQTADNSTISTNVIPIALVPHPGPDDRRLSDQPSQTSSAPSRPARSPNLNIRMDPLHAINLDHVNVSDDSLRPNVPHAYAPSHVSRITNASRMSQMTSVTTGSFASDMGDAPQIVNVNSPRVIKVARAAVIRTPGSPNSQNPTSPNSMMSTATTKGNVRSPLAQYSTSSEYPEEDDAEGQEVVMPQAIENTHTPQALDTSTSTAAEYHTNQTAEWLRREWDGNHGYQQFRERERERERDTYGNEGANDTGFDTRPSSIATVATMATQAGSVINADIGSATRVRIGVWPTGANEYPYGSIIQNQNQNRMTSARLVSPATSPMSAGSATTPGEFATAQARIVNVNGNVSPSANASSAPYPDPYPSRTRRLSASSVASAATAMTTATAGGDSVLAGFTFVPPSPIASRPPRSPLGANFGGARGQGQEERLAPRESGMSGMSGMSTMTARQQGGLAARTTSQISHVSQASQASGLAGYTFRIGSQINNFNNNNNSHNSHSNSHPNSNGTSSAGSGTPEGGSVRSQRASLDTLALTQDLSAFPLEFERTSGGGSVISGMNGSVVSGRSGRK